jgi:hypothetical protein
MSNPYVMGVLGALETRMQLVTSVEADFSTKEWKFRGDGLKVSSGDYLVISLAEWRKFCDEVQPVGKSGGTSG